MAKKKTTMKNSTPKVEASDKKVFKVGNKYHYIRNGVVVDVILGTKMNHDGKSYYLINVNKNGLPTFACECDLAHINESD